MQEQENRNQYCSIMPSNLKLVAGQKAIMIGILFGLFIPSLILEITGFTHSLNYLVKLSLGVVIITPPVALFIFVYIRSKYKCPKCKSPWSYFKVKETIIESFAAPPSKNNMAVESVRNERYLIESACSNCKYKNIDHKKRKVIKKSEEL